MVVMQTDVDRDPVQARALVSVYAPMLLRPLCNARR